MIASVKSQRHAARRRSARGVTISVPLIDRNFCQRPLRLHCWSYNGSRKREDSRRWPQSDRDRCHLDVEPYGAPDLFTGRGRQGVYIPFFSLRQTLIQTPRTSPACFRWPHPRCRYLPSHRRMGQRTDCHKVGSAPSNLCSK